MGGKMKMEKEAGEKERGGRSEPRRYPMPRLDRWLRPNRRNYY